MDEPVKTPKKRGPKPKPPEPIMMAPPQNTNSLNSVVLPEGDNNKYTAFSLALMRMPLVNLDKPEDVKQRIIDYFQLCADSDMKPGVASLAFSLGMDRRRLWEIKVDSPTYQRAMPQESKDYIKWAYNAIETLMENYMQNGKINPVSGIFLMKNNFNYQDRQDYVVTPNTTGEIPDPKTIAAKYEELPE